MYKTKIAKKPAIRLTTTDLKAVNGGSDVRTSDDGARRGTVYLKVEG
jgi:hypothetical protein